MTLMTDMRICPVCGDEYDASDGRLYCSEHCRLVAKRHRDRYPVEDGVGGAPQTFGERECPVCHHTFTARSMSQVYCKSSCRAKAAKRLTCEERTEFRRKGFRPRSFTCPVCKKTVDVTDPDDHRTRFCSHACEREFWRHRRLYEKGVA